MRVLQENDSKPLIEFTQDEVALAERLADLRRGTHPTENYKRSPRPGVDRARVDSIGLLAEMAVHWWTRLPWSAYIRDPSNPIPLPDVGLLEVRGRAGGSDGRKPHECDLPLRSTDTPGIVLVLVTLDPPQAWIQGWRELADDTPIWPVGDMRYVPRAELLPMRDLPQKYWPHGRYRP